MFAITNYRTKSDEFTLIGVRDTKAEAGSISGGSGCFLLKAEAQPTRTTASASILFGLNPCSN